MKKVESKVKRIPSDQPTALIAPSDYQHIFKLNDGKEKNAVKSKKEKRIPSDQPTALIAPSDYQHIFKLSDGKTGTGPGESAKVSTPPEKKKSLKLKAKRIPSDQPTALIAPSDYQHIFRAKEEQKTEVAPVVAKKVNAPGGKVARVASDQPTALIAPSDYQHIYKLDKGQQGGSKQPTAAAVPPKRAPPPPPVGRNAQRPPFNAVTLAPATLSNQLHKSTPRQEVLPPSIAKVVNLFINKQSRQYTIHESG